MDYDHRFNYQCVDLILQGLHDIHGIGSGVMGNAIQYWTNPSLALLDKFKQVSGSEAHKGDIVVLHGREGNAFGHIGWATGNINDTQLEILEQNGYDGSGNGLGDNVIRVRHVERHRVAGLLRPKKTAIAPATPPPIVHPYHIEPITSKRVKINKNTHKWGLNYDNYTAIHNNPQADVAAGTIKTVYAVLHHNIGYNYYLTNPKDASGYSVADCDDYLPPLPVPPPVKPYQPPAGPMVIPNTETYYLALDLPGFITSNQAINRINPKVVIPAGTYFVFNKRFSAEDPNQLKAINLTKTAGKPGGWINAADNLEPSLPEPEAPEEQLPVPEPLPEPDFTETYVPLSEPQLYVAMASLPVVDFGGTKVVTMPKYSVSYISGTFTINGVEYARPKSAADKGLWYGIEWFDYNTGLPNIELESKVYSADTTVTDRQAIKTLKPIDRLALGIAHFKSFYLGFAIHLGRIRLALNKNKK